MEIQLDKRFSKRLQARYDRFELLAGVLDNKPYRTPRRGKKNRGTLEGGPVRRQSGIISGTILQVSNIMQRRTNYLIAPVKNKNSRDYKAFRLELMRFLSGQGGQRYKVIQYLRAMIRNPMLKQKYGRNTLATAHAKGFNRFMFDTGQLFRNIKSKIMRSSRVP